MQSTAMKHNNLFTIILDVLFYAAKIVQTERNTKRNAVYFVLPRCSLSYTEIVQGQRKLLLLRLCGPFGKTEMLFLLTDNFFWKTDLLLLLTDNLRKTF